MEKYSANNHTKTLLASRNALFLLFALPGVAFATWISRTAATRDMLAVSNAEMGWILFGLSVGSIIGLLSASRFIDCKGARDVIIGSMFFMIVGLICLGINIYFVFSMGAFSSLLVFGVGYGFAEGSANDWLPIVMVDGHEQSIVAGSIMYAIFVLAMTLTRMSSSYFLDRFGRVAVVRATIMMAILGISIVIFGSNSYFLAFGVVLWGIGAALGFPIGLSAAGDDRENATSNVAAVSIIGYTAFLVGPPFLGILGEAFGIRNALLAVLLFVLLSGIVSSITRENTPS